MSAKSAIKVIVPDGADGALFKWVARLTGSKNALKGVGFFVGGALLAALRVRRRFGGDGRSARRGPSGDGRLPFRRPGAVQEESQIHLAVLEELRKSTGFQRRACSCFASRDVWFVVGLPVFLSQFGWSFYAVGAFLALWVIGYGFIQAGVPEMLRALGRRDSVDGTAARHWAFVLLLVPLALVEALRLGTAPGGTLMIGLAVFAVIFAINSAVHSYLILAYTDEDSVALDVGFYYMANAGGRLLGTLLSGLVFRFDGFQGCLWASAVLVFAAASLSLGLPRGHAIELASVDVGGGE